MANKNKELKKQGSSTCMMETDNKGLRPNVELKQLFLLRDFWVHLTTCQREGVSLHGTIYFTLIRNSSQQGLLKFLYLKKKVHKERR